MSMQFDRKHFATNPLPEFFAVTYKMFEADKINPVFVMGVGPEGKAAMLYAEDQDADRLIEALENAIIEINKKANQDAKLL